MRPPKRLLINAYLLFFAVQANQVGIGVLGFQRIIAKYAHQDAWIAVLLAGVFTHIVIWVMIRTLRLYGPTDLYGLHHAVWGKWIGSLLNLFYILLLTTPIIVIIESYIEVVQTWLAPDLPSWFVALCLLAMVIYGVLGGVRVIVGFCVLSFVTTIWMAFLAYFPFEYAVWSHLKPVWETKWPDMFQATQKMALTLSGFEVLFFLYPYLREPKQAMRYSQLAVLVSNILYLIAMITATVYFSHDQLMRNIWALLSILKIVQIPFLERFEYLIIPMWVLIILPNLLLYMWSSTYGMKRMFNLKQRHVLFVFAALLFVGDFFFNTRHKVNALTDFFNFFQLYAVFYYPFLLYGVALIKKSWSARKGGKAS